LSIELYWIAREFSGENAHDFGPDEVGYRHLIFRESADDRQVRNAAEFQSGDPDTGVQHDDHGLRRLLASSLRV
jgi:hypothetical protein